MSMSDSENGGRTELDDELREEVDEELTKSYIAGLIDGTATVSVSCSKDSTYAMGYALQAQIKFHRKEPFGLQVLDEWAQNNGIFVSIRQYDDRYEVQIGKLHDLERFMEEIVPYVQDSFDQFHIMLDGLLEKLQNGYHRESKENFIEIMEIADEVNSYNKRRNSKYTADFFREEWDM